MSQFALPLGQAGAGRPSRIVIGPSNRQALEALQAPATWPFRTAIMCAPPRAGKSLIARWFAQQNLGDSLDDADRMDETDLFHRWNRAQEEGRPLLLTVSEGGWDIALPDLRSRLGAALHLEIGAPDDAMVAELIETLAIERGLALAEGALAYLAPRVERSYAAIEQVVEAIDRISLERKQPATLSIWRDALESVSGAAQPRLL